MSTSLRFGLGIAALAAAFGAVHADRAAADPATAGPPAGRLAFFRFLEGDPPSGAIFTMRTDGTREQQLTHPGPGVFDDFPDWSPDGRQIAFQRCGIDTGCTVWVVAAHRGAEPRQVRFRCHLAGDCDASGPTWTPDGRLLVTLAQGQVKLVNGQGWIQQSGIESIDLRTGTQRTIYRVTPWWSGDAQDPAPSPDGRTIAYEHDTPFFGRAVFVVRTDGSHNHQVTPWALSGGDHVEFSPRGTILFRSYDHDDTAQSDFWTVRPNGSALRQLTHVEPGTWVTPGSYSPDGNWIVHATNGVGGPADVFIMRADGTGNRPLTRTPNWDGNADWAP